MDSLVALLHEDATQNMPPFEMWLRGRDDLVAWFTGPGHGCRGSRCRPLEVNGSPAFAQWRPAGDGWQRWGVHVLDVVDGRVAGITTFLDTRLFDLFGLPRDPGPQPRTSSPTGSSTSTWLAGGASGQAQSGS